MTKNELLKILETFATITLSTVVDDELTTEQRYAIIRESANTIANSVMMQIAKPIAEPSSN